MAVGVRTGRAENTRSSIKKTSWWSVTSYDVLKSTVWAGYLKEVQILIIVLLLFPTPLN